jgi:hypothetical protein
MGRFCRFRHELVSALNWLRQAFLAQIQESLLWRQFSERVLLLDRGVQESMSAQQHSRVGQQGHAPRQTQAVEEYLAQAQLVLLIGLRRLNPGAHLLDQPLGGQAGQGQQSQESFM